MAATKIRIVCISDTHNYRSGEGFVLPKGDVLIHAGDLTNQGTSQELRKALDWIGKADFLTKVVVAGNHDLSLDPDFMLKHKPKIAAEEMEASRRLLALYPNVHFLQHEQAVIEIPGKNVSLRVFGSPFSPAREGKQKWAFQYERDAAQRIWNQVPKDGLDILVTHTPSAGLLDASMHWQEGGCTALREAVSAVRPRLHVCGHCHEGRGALIVLWNSDDGVPDVVSVWKDPGHGNKKQSLVNLCNRIGPELALIAGKETAVVNASIMAQSHGREQRKEFHKPMVVDMYTVGLGKSCRETGIGLKDSGSRQT